MNLISFSLYGNDPKYVRGMIRNAELAPVVYPGWKVVVYHRDQSPGVLEALAQFGCDLRPGPEWLVNPMMWRFLAFGEPGTDRCIVRDADSRLNMKEAKSVEAWIESGLFAHVMRDHVHHKWVMPGGMIGIHAASWTQMTTQGLIRRWGKAANEYQNDVAFLRDAVWPLIKGSVLQHDSCLAEHFPCSDPFPVENENRWRFVGEVFDDKDQPRDFDWQQRINRLYQ